MLHYLKICKHEKVLIKYLKFHPLRFAMFVLLLSTVFISISFLFFLLVYKYHVFLDDYTLYVELFIIPVYNDFVII